jgi:hypothetical protein
MVVNYAYARTAKTDAVQNTARNVWTFTLYVAVTVKVNQKKTGNVVSVT